MPNKQTLEPLTRYIPLIPDPYLDPDDVVIPEVPPLSGGPVNG